MKTVYKTLKLVLVLCLLPIVPRVTAQQIHGIVKSKTSTIHFEEFSYGENQLQGDIHSNLSGTKYTVNMHNGSKKLEGVIKDKYAKFSVDLSYNDSKIEGEIKRSTNGTKDVWDVNVLNKKLSGKVVHNALKTVDTYQLTYGNKNISGRTYKELNKHVYELQFGEKTIIGDMAYNVTTVKHTYNLKGDGLTDDEFIVFVFIESIKLINERIAEIEEFQGEE
ncbi:hypothetical protein [Saccharicrinis aurantiacus]|uniref:hypothetical protein n=1 Tax=Saccharicrinis aurantiacus TaxID=1849719 RepID=UPI00094FBCFD|nr:hypothetical protein [Saccharicrinis aurantiacus]